MFGGRESPVEALGIQRKSEARMAKLVFVTAIILLILVQMAVVRPGRDEMVRIPIDLPIKPPPPKVIYTGICETSGTLVCKQIRKDRAMKDKTTGV